MVPSLVRDDSPRAWLSVSGTPRRVHAARARAPVPGCAQPSRQHDATQLRPPRGVCLDDCASGIRVEGKPRLVTPARLPRLRCPRVRGDSFRRDWDRAVGSALREHQNDEHDDQRQRSDVRGYDHGRDAPPRSRAEVESTLVAGGRLQPVQEQESRIDGVAGHRLAVTTWASGSPRPLGWFSRQTGDCDARTFRGPIHAPILPDPRDE